MEITQSLYVATRDEWRTWLEQNHASATEIWLIYYKKDSGQPRIPYDDAVEEALCFGWIDSIVKKVDDEKFAQKFTPRKNTNKWSALNKDRLRKMIQAGKMTPAGLAKIGDALNDDASPESPPPESGLTVPPELELALARNPAAQANFARFTEAYKRLGLKWIFSAKKDDTRQRRVAEFVELTAQGKNIGLK